MSEDYSYRWHGFIQNMREMFRIKVEAEVDPDLLILEDGRGPMTYQEIIDLAMIKAGTMWRNEFDSSVTIVPHPESEAGFKSLVFADISFTTELQKPNFPVAIHLPDGREAQGFSHSRPRIGELVKIPDATGSNFLYLIKRVRDFEGNSFEIYIDDYPRLKKQDEASVK